VLERKGTVEGEEGCLSFPGLFQKVRRARTVRVEFYNLAGQREELTINELESRAFQHETDHLHGSLFIDKMGFLARRASRGALEEFEHEYRKAQEKGEIPPNPEIEKMLSALEVEVM
jgi:peptide deformylase